MKKCPYCAEEIQNEAIKCKHCGEMLGVGKEIVASPEKVKGSSFCALCNRQVATKNPPVNHILHLLLSIITGGIWLIVWLIIVLSNSGEARCSICGAKVK